MRKNPYLLVLFALLLIPQSTIGQQEDEALRKLPGYVDFGAWTEFKTAESTVEVYIKDPILALIARLTRDEDSELSNLLSSLKLIRVQTYSLDVSDTEKIKTRVGELRKKLEKDKWEIVVRARERDEQVHVYIKSTKDKINGLVIMAVEYGDEVAFVNIVGEFDLNSIARLGDKFDIPGLDSLKIPPSSKRGGAR
ncbi:MAG: DUF4252 domain-containing protein [Candidatus Latescibacteria bacterium]|nr:DUF4252 domain-containing protein [Candidatus Latescibacterota bacterium]